MLKKLNVKELKKPARINRHAYRHSFRQLQNRTEVFKASYVPSTILDWNANLCI